MCVINQLGMITPYKSLQTPRSASEVALRDEQKRDPHAGSNHQNGNLCRFRRADIGEMHYVTMWMYTPGISQIKKPEKKKGGNAEPSAKMERKTRNSSGLFGAPRVSCADPWWPKVIQLGMYQTGDPQNHWIPMDSLSFLLKFNAGLLYNKNMCL